MDDEATQQSTQDRVNTWSNSVSTYSNDNALCVLVGSMGMHTRWELVPRDGDGDGGRTWTFGRSMKADFQLDFHRKRLSNIHFKIWATNDVPPTLMLTDCSTNGTYLNNMRMSKGMNCMLVNGDVITVGVGIPEDEVRFIVSVPRSETAPPPTTGINAVYEFGTLLGQGAFAQVRLAVRRETGQRFAVKIIQKSKITAGVAVGREIDVLRSVQHQNIVCLNEFYEDTNSYYLVMDYVPGGDLMDYVQSQGYVEEEPSREIIRQVLAAIQHVHRMGISHRDLKPDNILIAQDDPVSVKIADFGLAKISTQGTFLKTFCGTLSYLAPEVLASRNSAKSSPQGYSQLVDIWSVGCLAYVILTGYMPFNGTTQEELYRCVQAGAYNKEPLQAVGLSPACTDFISRLLEVDVSKRPTAAQALQHPWMMQVYGESEGRPMPAPNSYELKGLSSLNICSSQAPLATDGVFPAANLPSDYSQPAPDLGNDSSGVDHGDSESDTSEMQTRANIEASQRQVREVGSLAGVRDLDALSSIGADPVPTGSWLKLATQPNSIPFKDIYISSDVFRIGRDRYENVDLEIKDNRLSKLHCSLQRVRNGEGRWEIWFNDYSSNGAYINGVSCSKNHRTRLFDGDNVWLFAHLSETGVPTMLGFDVIFLDRLHCAADRDQPVKPVPLPATEIPVVGEKPRTTLARPKRSDRSLSLGRRKRRVTTVKPSA